VVLKRIFRLVSDFTLARQAVRSLTYLSNNSSMIDHSPCICGHAAHCASDMLINFEYFLNRAGFHKWRGDTLLNCENDTFGSLNTDCSCSQLLRTSSNSFEADWKTKWRECIIRYHIFPRNSNEPSCAIVRALESSGTIDPSFDVP
jgi:hypothetical protein